jgi:hypothetical protein
MTIISHFQNLMAKIPQTKNKIKVPVLLAFLSQKISLLLHTVQYYGKWLRRCLRVYPASEAEVPEEEVLPANTQRG